MAYKGINTLTLELKQQLETVVTYYLNQGVNYSSIYMTLNNVLNGVEFKLNKSLQEEKRNFDEESKQEKGENE